MRVRVYRNLHKKCYSIVSLEKENYGKVVAHKEEVVLMSARFKVSEKGRQRVIREKRKNVHAYVVGHLEEQLQGVETWERWLVEEVSYNPYKSGNFQSKKDGRAICEASLVILSASGVFI
jgi:hypothetical protein